MKKIATLSEKSWEADLQKRHLADFEMDFEVVANRNTSFLSGLSDDYEGSRYSQFVKDCYASHQDEAGRLQAWLADTSKLLSREKLNLENQLEERIVQKRQLLSE